MRHMMKSSFRPRTPPNRTSVLWYPLSSHIHTKKRGASYRTRPALRGLRIAHTVWTSNAESPTPIRIYMPQKYLYTERVHRYKEGINIPLSYLPLQCPWLYVRSLRSSCMPRTKRKVNAFFLYMSVPTLLRLYWGFGVRTGQKYELKLKMKN